MADPKTQHSDKVGYETSDANLKMIIISAIILTVVVVVSFIIVRLTFSAMQKDIDHNTAPLPVMFESDVLPPAPRLRINGKMKLATLHAYEKELLNSYEWVDKDLGLVRIPLARAKQILLEQKGAPFFPAPEVIVEDEAAAAAPEPHAAPHNETH
ncbi:MAG: hypothetical protein O3C57_04980 [Verrucomicrobia bacterium]|nr:hypothetical protein [Verrucomicrobiota bacterium]